MNARVLVPPEPLPPPHREPKSDSALVHGLTITERGGAIQVHAHLPGLDTGALEVTVVDGLLTLKGCQCRYGPFERAVHLPAPVHAGQMRVSYEQNRLTVVLPRAAK